jgi:hypothetical protein
MMTQCVGGVRNPTTIAQNTVTADQRKVMMMPPDISLDCVSVLIQPPREDQTTTHTRRDNLPSRVSSYAFDRHTQPGMHYRRAQPTPPCLDCRTRLGVSSVYRWVVLNRPGRNATSGRICPLRSVGLLGRLAPTRKGDFQVPGQVQLHSEARYPKAAAARWTGSAGQKDKSPGAEQNTDTSSWERLSGMQHDPTRLLFRSESDA